MNVPEGYEQFTHAQRLSWHEERVNSDQVAYDWLEQNWLWNPVDENCVLECLDVLRAKMDELARLEEMLVDHDFSETWEALQFTVGTLNQIATERAAILAKVFRRQGMSKTPDECNRLELLALEERMCREHQKVLESDVVWMCGLFEVPVTELGLEP